MLSKKKHIKRHIVQKTYQTLSSDAAKSSVRPKSVMHKLTNWLTDQQADFYELQVRHGTFEHG